MLTYHAFHEKALITSGRLSDTNKEIVKNVYDQEPNKTAALMMAQQIIVSSPEFHSTGLVEKTGVLREESGNYDLIQRNERI